MPSFLAEVRRDSPTIEALVALGGEEFERYAKIKKNIPERR